MLNSLTFISHPEVLKNNAILVESHFFLYVCDGLRPQI
ncbi:hypothetical protein FORMB_05500 [Formosa sp. Hel1_33_131]|nr:hypothetical protein FORMB_05500 [Formosa sp. Hel1_33_131]